MDINPNSIVFNRRGLCDTRTADRVCIDLSTHFNYGCASFSSNLRERTMADHSHRFIEEFDGFVGFGLNPESDMDAVTYYLQKFSDDQLMALLRTRLTNDDRQAIFDLISGLLRKHLTEPEYHRYFLKDTHNH
jgi:hypothetical protein